MVTIRCLKCGVSITRGYVRGMNISENRVQETAKREHKRAFLSLVTAVSDFRSGSTTDSHDLPLPRPELGDKQTQSAR